MGTVGESVWHKIPYASLFATLLMLAGIFCFTASLYMGLDDLEELMNDTFNVHHQVLWMGTVKYLMTVAGVVMGIYGIILLIFGALATGATRQNVYSGAKCILGGRCTAVFFMLLTYLFNLVWICITSALAIPVMFMVMINSICMTQFAPNNEYQPGPSNLALSCFNLTRFGLYFPGYNEKEPDNWWHAPALCYQHQITALCDSASKERTLFSAAFAGSFVILIALVSFSMILSGNYQRIKTSKELTDYREALDNDNTEMDNIISNRKQFASSYAPSDM